MRWFNQLTGHIQDWIWLTRRSGWRSAISQITQDIITFPYHHTKFVIVARSLLEPLPDLQPKMALEIREFEPGDVDLVRQINRPSEANICARRLVHGHIGLIAQHDDQAVGYAWACAESSLERVRIPLDEGDVLCTDAYTAPAFRGYGVQTTLVLARFHRVRDLGYKRALAFIIESNSPSMAVWRKMGSQVVQRGDFKRIGPWRRVRYD